MQASLLSMNRIMASITQRNQVKVVLCPEPVVDDMVNALSFSTAALAAMIVPLQNPQACPLPLVTLVVSTKL